MSKLPRQPGIRPRQARRFIQRASRTTQPLRRSRNRKPGAALTAARRGRTAAGYNPQDAQRAVARNFRKRARKNKLRFLAR
jgi:hypothetical protein